MTLMPPAIAIVPMPCREQLFALAQQGIALLP
jgi:hypothetical protein